MDKANKHPVDQGEQALERHAQDCLQEEEQRLRIRLKLLPQIISHDFDPDEPASDALAA